MAAPTLHLTIDKGPKNGETLTPKPTSTVRIGRVVKGNNFTIKDPGISQKHLTIAFTPSISKWTVTDLGTSNGTSVNDFKIPPSDPFPLSHGDIIKIGETTLISVKIHAEGEMEAGLEGRQDEEPKNLRRGRSRMTNSEKDEILGSGVENGGGLRPRRGNSKKLDSRVSKKDEILDGNAEETGIGLRPRRRGAPTRAAASARNSKDEMATETDQVVSLKDAVVLDSDVEDNIPVAPKNRRRGRQRKAPALTRASPAKVAKDDGDKEEGKEDEGVVEDSIEVPKNNARRGRPRKSPVRTRVSVSEVQIDEEEAVEVEEDDEVENGREEEEGEKAVEETEVDLEKMTLGEWFDSLEKYLPRAINQVAEEMIANLREKAKLFDEYVANESNAT